MLGRKLFDRGFEKKDSNKGPRYKAIQLLQSDRFVFNRD